MEPLSLIQQRFRPINGEAVSKLEGMHSSDEMERALKRERARSDRNGSEFALVVFKIEKSKKRLLPAWLLGGAMVSRARATDEIGWFDESDVAALLPDTSAAGARRFADDICAIVDGKIARPSYVLYTYPQDHPREDREDRSGERGADSRRSNRSIPGMELRDTAVEPVRQHAQANGTPVESLQTLLVHPTPGGKRLFDICSAATALLLLSPVLAVAAIAVKLTSDGPAIFRQRRAGLGGKPFTMYKLRTMIVDAEAQKHKLMKRNEQDGPAFKIKNDPRLTRIGRFLRRTSIDELPQLWNVLKGDMTIVGPRPLPCDESARCERWQRRRLDVAPGLTCIWQVYGRSRVTFAEWVRMDIAYISNLSARRDWHLILHTIPAVLFGRGAH